MPVSGQTRLTTRRPLTSRRRRTRRGQPCDNRRERFRLGNAKIYAGDTGSVLRNPLLLRRKVLALADRLAGALPGREFSMASLQEYYLISPAVEAVEGAVTWVEGGMPVQEVEEALERSGTR